MEVLLDNEHDYHYHDHDNSSNHSDYNDMEFELHTVCDKQEVRSFAGVFLPVVYTLALILGLAGNSMVIFIYLSHKHRTTITSSRTTSCQEHSSAGSGGLHRWRDTRVPVVGAAQPHPLLEDGRSPEVGRHLFSQLFFCTASSSNSKFQVSPCLHHFHRKPPRETLCGHSSMLRPLQRRFLPQESLQAASTPAMGLCHRPASGCVSAKG